MREATCWFFFPPTLAWCQIPDWPFPDQPLRPSQPGYWLFPHSFPPPLLANSIAFSFGIDCIDFPPPQRLSLKNHSNRNRAMWTAAPWTVPPRILHSMELLWKPESNWQPGLNVINRRWRAKEKQTRETTQIKVHSRPRGGWSISKQV